MPETDFDVTEPMVEAEVTTRTADRIWVESFRVDAKSRTIQIVAWKGEIVGGEFVPERRQSVTLADTFDENGAPLETGWTDFKANERIYNQMIAAGAPVSNGQALRDFVIWLLKQAGVE